MIDDRTQGLTGLRSHTYAAAEADTCSSTAATPLPKAQTNNPALGAWLQAVHADARAVGVSAACLERALPGHAASTSGRDDTPTYSATRSSLQHLQRIAGAFQARCAEQRNTWQHSHTWQQQQHSARTQARLPHHAPFASLTGPFVDRLAPEQQQPEARAYDAWLASVQRDARARGVGDAIIDRAFQTVTEPQEAEEAGSSAHAAPRNLRPAWAPSQDLRRYVERLVCVDASVSPPLVTCHLEAQLSDPCCESSVG